MLTKSNYAVYITVLIFSFLYFDDKIYVLKNIFISIIFHLVPLSIWHIILDLKGMGMLGIFSEPVVLKGLSNPFDILINYYLNSGITKSYYPGSSLITLFNSESILISIHNLYYYIIKFINWYGNIWIFFTIYFLIYYRNKHKTIIVLFLFVFIFSSFLQVYAAWPNKVKARLLMDSMFLFYSFGICGIYHLISTYFKNFKKSIMTLIMIIMIIFNINPSVSTTWVHPLEQNGNNIIGE